MDDSTPVSTTTSAEFVALLGMYQPWAMPFSELQPSRNLLIPLPVFCVQYGSALGELGRTRSAETQLQGFVDTGGAAGSSGAFLVPQVSLALRLVGRPGTSHIHQSVPHSVHSLVALYYWYVSLWYLRLGAWASGVLC